MEQPPSFVAQGESGLYAGSIVPYMASSTPLELGLAALASWYMSLV